MRRPKVWSDVKSERVAKHASKQNQEDGLGVKTYSSSRFKPMYFGFVALPVL